MPRYEPVRVIHGIAIEIGLHRKDGAEPLAAASLVEAYELRVLEARRDERYPLARQLRDATDRLLDRPMPYGVGREARPIRSYLGKQDGQLPVRMEQGSGRPVGEGSVERRASGAERPVEKDLDARALRPG